MPLEPKIEKRIDTLYRNTRQMPLLAILGILVPIILIIGGPLGLLYWFWRRDLLRAVDSGAIVLDPVPPSLPGTRQSGNLSSAAKLEFIRSRKQSLLIPFYLLVVTLILIGVFIVLAAIHDHYVAN
jgi:hypothetical protein